jgi:hypothetical protein
MPRFSSKTPSEDAAVLGVSVGTAIVGLSGDPRLQETTFASAKEAGVFGASENGTGVLGYARASDMPAVYAFGGLLAIALAKEFAGVFRGNVKVEGDIVLRGNVKVEGGDILLAGADCAEQFDVVAVNATEPGSVLVIDEDGALRESNVPYDTKVAGVIAGAGTYRPGIILDQRPLSPGRVCVSLIGKVFCKVDGAFGPIAVGDLLTTSSTLGHAMKASDPQRAFGAVLGKALGPWTSAERGIIPILVALA